MGQTSILFKTRLRALKNRFRDHSTTWWLAVATGFLLLTAIIIGLGQLAAPFLSALPADLTSGDAINAGANTRPLQRGEGIPGARALDAAFWMTSLVASVLIFRVMELLFRRDDIRAVENYPIQLRALFVDRLAATLLEAAIAGTALSLFFVPIAWHLTPSIFILCAVICLAGLLVGSSLTLVIQLFAGDSQIPDAHTAQNTTSAGRQSTGDVYGGSGQIFLFAPALALAFVVVILLLIKLLVGEYLIADRITRPLEMGMTAVAALAAFSIYLSYRYFTRAFPAMAARFREADYVTFNPYQPYQKSAFAQKSRFERILPARLLSDSARAMFRADLLQYSRRYMMSRYLYVLFWAAAAFAFFKLESLNFISALGGGLLAVLPALLLAMLANPWRRLNTQRAHATLRMALPVGPRDLHTAATLFAAREALLFTFPYALLAVLIRLLADGFTTDSLLATAPIALCALTSALAVNGATAFATRFFGPTNLLATTLPIAIGAALLVTGFVSFPILLVASTLLTLLNLSAWISHDRPAHA